MSIPPERWSLSRPTVCPIGSERGQGLAYATAAVRQPAEPDEGCTVQKRQGTKSGEECGGRRNADETAYTKTWRGNREPQGLSVLLQEDCERASQIGKRKRLLQATRGQERAQAINGTKRRFSCT